MAVDGKITGLVEVLPKSSTHKYVVHPDDSAIQTVERLEPDKEPGGLYFSGKQGLTGLF